MPASRALLVALCALACACTSGAIRDLKGAAEAGAGAQAGSVDGLRSYPPVSITNEAGAQACGKVAYASIFCSDDTYCVEPGATWTAAARGVCLVTRITASVAAAGGSVAAEPYTSSGTSYSQFKVAQLADGKYEVQRIKA